MLMLTAYMDETGHSRDEKQHFNGMAGLMAPAEYWEVFEDKWYKLLTKFRLPYIHMKEMRTLLAGWSESKIKKLSEAVWKVIKETRAMPIGSIIPMDDFRPLEEKLRRYALDPYYLAMQDCISLSTISVMPGPFMSSDSRVTMIFSDQVEFKHEAHRMFDAAVKADKTKPRVDPPAFHDMRDLLPLQAADVVAYEIYKEYDRTYYGRSSRKKRYGYEQLEEMIAWLNEGQIIQIPGYIMRHTKKTLKDIVGKASAQTELMSIGERGVRGKRRRGRISDLIRQVYYCQDCPFFPCKNYER
jgi:Protein of unknown function (DUF3800)